MVILNVFKTHWQPCRTMFYRCIFPKLLETTIPVMLALLVIYLIGFAFTAIYVAHIMKNSTQWNPLATLGAASIWPIIWPVIFIVSHR